MTTLSSTLPPHFPPPLWMGPPTPAASWWVRRVVYPFRVWVARTGRVLIAWAAIGPSVDEIERGHQNVFRHAVYRKFDELIDLQMEFRQILDERHGHLAAGLESIGATVEDTRTDWSAANQMLATLKAQQGSVSGQPGGGTFAIESGLDQPPPEASPPVFVAAQPLRLLAPDGTLEAEVGWPYAEIPVEREHHGQVYRRKHFANEDGHWEFVRT